MTPGKYYILNENKKAIPCDVLTWGKFFEDTEKRVVARTQLTKTCVSTVFLGLDHQYGYGDPLLFETMVFPKDSWSEEYTERYTTWDEAEAGHKRISAFFGIPSVLPKRYSRDKRKRLRAARLVKRQELLKW